MHPCHFIPATQVGACLQAKSEPVRGIQHRLQAGSYPGQAEASFGVSDPKGMNCGMNAGKLGAGRIPVSGGAGGAKEGRPLDNRPRSLTRSRSRNFESKIPERERERVRERER